MVKITTATTVISSIDTTQTKDKLENRLLKIDVVLGMNIINMKDGYLTTKWNPNVQRVNLKLSETKKELQQMFELATVIDTKALKMNRLDINSDIDIQFSDIQKMLSILFMCVTLGVNGIRKEWLDKDKLEQDSFWFRSQYMDVEFYNKAKESNGTSKYPTRLEIRLKKIKSQDLEYHITKVIKLYTEALENWEGVEQDRIKVLCAKWDKFKMENQKATLTHFVVANENEIYTKEILEALYKYVGLKGRYKSWLDKFRQGYKLDLYGKKDIEKLIKRIVISLKRYKNS